MRKTRAPSIVLGLLGAVVSPALAPRAAAQGPAPSQPTYRRTAEVGGRLAPSEQRYASIDPARLRQLVDEVVAMSRRYRDRGHPQFWGRIIGTETDAESARWMIDKFRKLGLTDVREQPIDLAPQWMPRSWSLVASSQGASLELPTAQPTHESEGTPAEGLDLEAVYVGLGSDADLALSRDVRGKAAVFYSTDLASRHITISGEAIRRIGERGAAAILVILGIPGNQRTQFYTVGSKVPTFILGLQDGLALRDMIGRAASQPARIKIRLDVELKPGLKTATVWGSLPGTTDESIFVVAHRDGWFDGANDNATGMATMIALAEYFSNMPRADRRRTITFLGTSGHHTSGPQSATWFVEHPEVFARAALLLNCEHTGAVQTGHAAPRLGNAPGVSTWYAGGPRLARIVTDALDAFGVPTFRESQARPGGEITRYFQYAPSVQVMSSGFAWHSDQETQETISTAGHTALTRAYAKIMTDVNALDLGDLRSPQASQ